MTVLGCTTPSVGADGPLSISDAHGCALVSGHVYCWGSTLSGRFLDPDPILDYFVAVPRQLPIPGTFIDVIAGPTSQDCAIDSGESLYCWGNNYEGTLSNGPSTNGVVTVPLSGVKRAAAGEHHTCALRDPGSGKNVYCWGANSEGQIGLPPSTMPSVIPTPTLLPGVQGATQISIARSTSCALGTGGHVWCWGGDATHPEVADLGVQDVVEIALGGPTNNHLYYRDMFGAIWLVTRDSGGIWGASTSVPTMGTASQLVVDDYLCVVDAVDHKQVRCSAELSSSYPDSNQTLPANVLKLVAGHDRNAFGVPFQCASLEDGTVRCWGDDGTAKLGIGYPESVRTPMLVDLGGAHPVSIFPAGTSVVVQLADHSMLAWGTSRPLYGDLEIHTPGLVPVLSTVSEPVSYISTQLEDHAYVIGPSTQMYLEVGQNKANKGLYSQGALTLTHVFAGDTVDCGSTSTDVKLTASGASLASPVTPPGTQAGDVVDVLTGVSVDQLGLGNYGGYDAEQHGCARMGSQLRCWGANDDGQTAQPMGTDTWPPAVVKLGTVELEASSLCVGRFHTCASTPAGDVYCWGYNASLQTVPDLAKLGLKFDTPQLVTTMSPPVQVSCREWFSCAWNSASAKCWGENDVGQLGDPSVDFSLGATHVVQVPDLPPAGYDTILDLVTNDSHSCALVGGLSGSAVACWGDNRNGRVGTGPTQNVPIARKVCGLD